MDMLPIRRLVGLAVLAGAASVMSGCYAAVEPAPVYTTNAVVADGYEPAYYDGYVVYYDDFGHPYYYNNGAMVWIPATSPHYVGLVNHWHAYGPQYRTWYAHNGYRYRTYRAPAGHYSYHTHGTVHVAHASVHAGGHHR